MDLVIAYPFGDGVSIIHPVPQARRMVPDGETMRPETDAEFAAWVAAKDVPTGVPFLIFSKAELPPDRSQRELWTADFSNPNGYGA